MLILRFVLEGSEFVDFVSPSPVANTRTVGLIHLNYFFPCPYRDIRLYPFLLNLARIGSQATFWVPLDEGTFSHMSTAIQCSNVFVSTSIAPSSGGGMAVYLPSKSSECGSSGSIHGAGGGGMLAGSGFKEANLRMRVGGFELEHPT